MTKYIFISIICLSAHYSYGQTWPKIYGDGFDSNIRGLLETYDGGYIIAGNISTNRYMWLIKVDINGNIIWDKKIGNPSNFRSYVDASATTLDHGIILAGGSKKYDPDGYYDPAFYKFDSCFNLEWCRVLMSPDYNLSTGIIQDNDGTFTGMMAYYGGDITTVRISLVKLDESGEPIWISHLAQEDSLIYNEEGLYFYLSQSGNYLVSGRCYYPGSQPFWILTDNHGDQIWDLKGGHYGQAHQVIEPDSGIFISTAFFHNGNMPLTPTLFHFEEDGNLLNRYFLFGDTIEMGSASGICHFNDTSYVIGVCLHDENPVLYDNSELILTDDTGKLIKRKLLINEYKVPRNIIITFDSKILVGNTYLVDNNWDIYMWKLNSDLEFDTLYSQPFNYDSLCPYPIVSDTIDYDCDLFVNIEDLPTKEEYEQSLKVFPNPASEYVVFDLKEKETNRNCVIQIFNAIGTKQEGRRVTPGSLHVTINIQNYPPGPYIAVLRNDERIIAKGKFVVGR